MNSFVWEPYYFVLSSWLQLFQMCFHWLSFLVQTDCVGFALSSSEIRWLLRECQIISEARNDNSDPSLCCSIIGICQEISGKCCFIDASDRVMQWLKIRTLTILELLLCSSAGLCPAYQTFLLEVTWAHGQRCAKNSCSNTWTLLLTNKFGPNPFYLCWNNLSAHSAPTHSPSSQTALPNSRWAS